VVGVGHETFDETIVKTVIGMAHSLGLEVVAEGVETSDQLAFLRKNACDIIQGYVLSPPLPAAQFETFFARSRTESAVTG
jgi:EAL domain-containing protein (putative c-di-GMP-specific phosphodiesterase class I)